MIKAYNDSFVYSDTKNRCLISKIRRLYITCFLIIIPDYSVDRSPENPLVIMIVFEKNFLHNCISSIQMSLFYQKNRFLNSMHDAATVFNSYFVILGSVYLSLSYYINNFLLTISKKKFAPLLLEEEEHVEYIVQNSVLTLDDYIVLSEVCRAYNDCIKRYSCIRFFIGLPFFFTETKKFIKSKERIYFNICTIKKHLYQKQ